MDLKAYLRTLGKDRPRAEMLAARDGFARRCGTSLNYMKLVAYRSKKPNAELCIAIERESGGAVPVEELRPDIDWSFRRAADPEREVA